MSSYGLPEARQDLVDRAVDGLLMLLQAMAVAERAKDEPQKWDEEYAAHAVNDCIDRLFCAPDAGMPKPSERFTERYREVYDLAQPFLEEGFPLPGSLEEDAAERERKLWAERWPELSPDDRPPGDAIKAAIAAEALRDARAARA